MAAVKIVPGNSKFRFEFWEAGCADGGEMGDQLLKARVWLVKCAWMQSQRSHSTGFWATGSKLSLVSTVHLGFPL